jgi:hypothetical protein
MEDNLKASDWPEAGGFQAANWLGFLWRSGLKPLQTFAKRGFSPEGHCLK